MLTPFQKEVDALLAEAAFKKSYTDKHGICRMRNDMFVYITEDYVDFMEFQETNPKVVRKFLILDADKIELIKKLIPLTRDCKTFDEFTVKYNEIKDKNKVGV
jgi:hypothetical protein